MDQQNCAAVPELELDFGRREPGVQRDEDRPGQAGGEQGLQEGGIVIAQIGHPVALAHAAVPKGVGEPGGTFRELDIAELPVPCDDGGFAAGLRAATLQP
ncbi:hypothetical protein BJQ90_02481 [Arthrobacter sp. SO3]|nr:hypothetical protein [Arthrobacter sp. SO3]